MNRITENEVIQIVRDLAKRNPCDEEGYCTLCGEFGVCEFVPYKDQLPDAKLHPITCPWRRAVELVTLNAI